MREIERLDIEFIPNIESVMLKSFRLNDERSKRLIAFVLALSDEKTRLRCEKTLMSFNRRHRSVTDFFHRSYKEIEHLVRDFTKKEVSEMKKILLGSYLSMEYSLQSAALFNPSIVPAPNQYDITPGSLRVYISLRAVGEGHISSIVFREAVIDNDGNFNLSPVGNIMDNPETVYRYQISKRELEVKLGDMHINDENIKAVMDSLPDKFYYDEVSEKINDRIYKNNLTESEKRNIRAILWLAESYTEIKFSLDSDISERIIFPISSIEKSGIEDARFIYFEEDGQYYANYTAYDGRHILPKLLITKDFLKFKISPLHGKYAQDKNFALFPRKINGKYAMLSRIDGENIFLMTSEDIKMWNEATMIMSPKHTWEQVQLGVCSPPLEVDEGWLVIFHGVGPVREYSISAAILDKSDPSQVLGRLKFPLIKPLESERNGYVPNVVYSCGAIIHNEYLFIPYAKSDYIAGMARIKLKELVSEIMTSENLVH